MTYVLSTGECAALLESDQVELALQKAFKKVQNYLVAEADVSSVSLQSCGSTACVALRKMNAEEIWVATLGDSRALLFDPAKGLLYETSDHKPNRADEAARIHAKGGEVIATNIDDTEVIHRVGSKTGKTGRGLAVSRAFGDLSLTNSGVTAEPEIVRWPTEGSDLYLLACSDGVWEHISSRQAVQIVYDTLQSEGSTVHDVVGKILQTSIAAWKKMSSAANEEPYCDDITLILAPISGSNWKEAETQVKARLDDEASCAVS